MKAANGRNASRRKLLLRARVVIPVAGRLIRDGAVSISGTRIAAVGRWRDLSPSFPGEALDLGNTALLPGLVNAHCHLDYTGMAGHIAPPKVFTEWLKLITELKAGWSHDDFAASWRQGAEMLLHTGTTTVGDIEALPALLPEAWDATPLRVLSFLELIGITSRRSPELVLGEARHELKRLAPHGGRLGLSPHAPYSTVPDLLKFASALARQNKLQLCIHAAESALEYEMFTQGSGSMFQWIQRSGRDMSDCGLGSPVAHLARSGILNSRLLVAHANYLHRNDARLLATSGAHVVHCPRSHFYFRHDPFPLNTLTRAGVNICLGTDSLASVYRPHGQKVALDMFAEMRVFQNANPTVPPQRVLRMATTNGAIALALKGQVGELAPGAFADLIAVPISVNERSVPEAIVHHEGTVAASMIGGQWAIRPQLTTAALPREPRPRQGKSATAGKGSRRAFSEPAHLPDDHL